MPALAWRLVGPFGPSIRAERPVRPASTTLKAVAMLHSPGTDELPCGARSQLA